MAVWKRPRAARAGESKRAEHFTYVLRWRLGGKHGEMQAVTVGHTRGHGRLADELDERLAARGFDVTKAEVLAWLAGDEDDDEPAPSVPTVGEVVADFMARPGLSPATRVVYRATVNRLGDLADVRVDKVTRKGVNRWFAAHEARGLKPKTLLTSKALLKGAMRNHVNVNELFADVRYDARDRVVTPRILTREQVQALIDNAAADGLALPIRVAAETGLRWGELVGLTADRIDLARGVISVDRQIAQRGTRKAGFKPEKLKSRASRREVFISDELAEALALVRDLPGDAPVFGQMGQRGHASKDWWAYPAFHRAWRRVVERTEGVPNDTRWHDLRHTAAMTWLRGSISLAHVSRLLGHSNVGITAGTYGSHWDDTDRARIVAAGLRLAE